MRGLSASRAVGLDGVPLIAVRECFSVVGPHLLKLVNLSLKTKVFPDDWKTACVVPIPKTGDPSVPSNNRPISLLSVLSKILEKVVSVQLISYLTETSILHPSQFGYRSCHSTEDAVLVAIERIAEDIDRGQVSSLTSIDLSKAFDCVDHGLLLDKLSWYGVTDLKWFQSYLSERKQVVRGGQLILPLTCGVPQGSILGPILFILFTNDVYAHLTHGRLISYADDTMHIDSARPDGPGLEGLKTRLELTMCELRSWFESNLLKMNEKKTAFMILGTKHNVAQAADFRLPVGDTSVKQSNNIKILGVTVDPGLSWSAHVSTVIKKCNGILVSLYRIRHYFTPTALKIIIQAYVFPHLTYCLCVWGGTAKGQLERIQKILNFAARVVTGIKKHDHVTPSLQSLGWPRIESMIVRRDVTKVFMALREEGVPRELRDLFTELSSVSSRDTRGSHACSLYLPLHRLTATQQFFSYRAAAAWNRLPPIVRTTTAITAFENALTAE